MNVQPRNNPTIAILTERSDGNTTKLFTNGSGVSCPTAKTHFRSSQRTSIVRRRYRTTSYQRR